MATDMKDMRLDVDVGRWYKWAVPALLLPVLTAACSPAAEPVEPTTTAAASSSTTVAPETAPTSEPAAELTLTWIVLELPEASGPPEALFSKATIDADGTAVFVARSGGIWRSTDLETFQALPEVPLDRSSALDVGSSTVVATNTGLVRLTCAYQGEGAQIAVSSDLGDTWSIVEAPVAEANLEHPERLWYRTVEVSTDGELLLVLVDYRGYEPFLSYSDCLVPRLGDGWIGIGETADGIVIDTGDEVRTFSFEELDLSDDDLAILTGEIEPELPGYEFWRYDLGKGIWSEAFVPTGVVHIGTDFVSTQWAVSRSSDGIGWTELELPDGVAEVESTKTAVVGTGRDSNWISLDAGRTWEEVASPVEHHPATDAINFAGTTFYLFQQEGYGGVPTLGYRNHLGGWQLTDLEEVAELGIVGNVSFLGVIDEALVIAIDSSANSLLVLRVEGAA